MSFFACDEAHDPAVDAFPGRENDASDSAVMVGTGPRADPDRNPGRRHAIWLTVKTPFDQYSRLVDIPNGFQQGSFTFDGVFVENYIPSPGAKYSAGTSTVPGYPDGYSYQAGWFSNQPVSVGFTLAPPSAASNPVNWQTTRIGMHSDITFDGVASGSFSWGNMDKALNEFQATMSSARLDPRPYVDLSDAPSFLLDLMKHPERVLMSEFESNRYGSSRPLAVTIAPPPPIPEPAALALFGVLISSIVMHRRKLR